MIVLGNHCFVFECSGNSCTMNPFIGCLGSAKYVLIIDAAIVYDFPYSHECYILLCRNALYLPNMEDNLLPPFAMCESGATVNDTLKIHCTDTTSKDHCITFSESELKITLHINGKFSSKKGDLPLMNFIHVRWASLLPTVNIGIPIVHCMS